MIYPKTKQIFTMMALVLLLNVSAKASQPTEENPTQTEISPPTLVEATPVDVTPVLPSTGTSSDPLPVTESAEQLEIKELRRALEALGIEKTSAEEKCRLAEEESSQQKSALENLGQQFEALRSESEKGKIDLEEKLGLIKQQESALENLRQEMERLRSESDSLRAESLQQESALKKLEEEAKDLRPIATAYSEDIKSLMEQARGFSIDPPELSSLLTGEKSLETLLSKARSLTEKIRAQQDVYRQSDEHLRKLYLLLACHRGGVAGGKQEYLKLAQSDLAKSGDSFATSVQTMLTLLKKTNATPAAYSTPLFSQFLCLAWLLMPDAVINDIELKGVWGKFLLEVFGSVEVIKEFLCFIEKLPSLEKTERV